MMQNWDQYDKKTARYHPKAENFPQSMNNSYQKRILTSKRRKKVNNYSELPLALVLMLIELNTQLKEKDLSMNKKVLQKTSPPNFIAFDIGACIPL